METKLKETLWPAGISFSCLSVLGLETLRHDFAKKKTNTFKKSNHNTDQISIIFEYIRSVYHIHQLFSRGDVYIRGNNEWLAEPCRDVWYGVVSSLWECVYWDTWSVEMTGQVAYVTWHFEPRSTILLQKKIISHRSNILQFYGKLSRSSFKQLLNVCFINIKPHTYKVVYF